jgi:glucose dehydrogenase
VAMLSTSATLADEWSSYGRDAAGTRYSPLTQITPKNVAQLREVWTYHTGKELWTATLPASAHALPITYEVGGKQFIVIAAGGAAKIDEERQGDAFVAFALP